MPLAMAASLSLATPLMLPSKSNHTTSFALTNHQKQVQLRRRFSCRASGGGQSDNNNQSGNFDRRDVLLGLGGLYGVAGLTSSTPLAAANPVQAPDLSKCGTPEDLPLDVSAACCPPIKDKIINFVPHRGKLRIRPAAHELDREYIAKYKKAMDLMRALPDSDPRSFSQQAKIHCAYCNGAYEQVGFEEMENQYLQIHNCWLFFPFHRWYLYFYERILGKLIGDPNFALPFWNWDAPDGYQIPAIFNDPSSPLFDQLRNQCHLPPALVDLDYSETEVGTVPTATNKEQTDVNLSVMYRQMVSNSKTPLLFFGEPYRAGSKPDPGAGSIENIPHGSIHVWCGDNRNPNLENMGNFYSAGRDPLFYSHHANVDRMWNLWKQLPGRKRSDITDPDWLNTTFLFYDENAQLVRVNVSDCRDSRKLGYVYDQMDLPWLKTKARPIGRSKSLVKKILHSIIGPVHAAEAAEKNVVALSDFPLTLEKAVSVVVPRPKKSRSKNEKEEEEEVLVVEGITFDKSLALKFDVIINDEDDNSPSGPTKTEFAGSFLNVPHGSNTKQEITTNLRIGISELLEDLGSEDDEQVVVSLVPKGSAAGKITIGGIKILLMS